MRRGWRSSAMDHGHAAPAVRACTRANPVDAQQHASYIAPMPQPWLLAQAPRPGLAVDAGAVALLFEAGHAATPGQAMLAFLNRLLPVRYLTVVEHADPAGPVLAEGHVHGADVPNITGECWLIYRRHFYGFDDATRLAARMRLEAPASAPLVALRHAQREIPRADWRRLIYERRQLVDRFSLLHAPARGAAFAINCYRDEAQGPFGALEVERLLALAPLLAQAHRQAASRTSAALDLDERIAAAREALRRRAPRLSARELDACARIACGSSVDAIAEDLGIAPSTVITLRRRAYAKLAVHDRLALARLAS